MDGDLIASLPWYDFDTTKQTLDSIWVRTSQILAKETGQTFATNLIRNQTPEALWRDRRTVLSQCCGPDLFTEAGGNLTVIARPVLAGLDCEPGEYYSFIVTRPNFQLSSHVRIAINSPTSHSGCSALLAWLAAREIQVIGESTTGSHQSSLDAVCQSLADIAAIDACTMPHLKKDPTSFVVIGESERALTPPFVCHCDTAVAPAVIAGALETAINETEEPALFTGLIRTERNDYRRMANQRASSRYSQTSSN